MPHSNILFAMGPATRLRNSRSHLRILAKHFHHFLFHHFALSACRGLAFLLLQILTRRALIFLHDLLGQLYPLSGTAARRRLQLETTKPPAKTNNVNLIIRFLPSQLLISLRKNSLRVEGRVSRGINCPSAVPTPETQKPKTLDTRLVTFYRRLETTAAATARHHLLRHQIDQPNRHLRCQSGFRRAAEPAGLTLAEAAESVFALSARLLFSIGPRCIASRALPTAGAAWLLRGATERAG